MYIGSGLLSIINTGGMMIFLTTTVGVVGTTRGGERVKVPVLQTEWGHQRGPRWVDDHVFDNGGWGHEGPSSEAILAQYYNRVLGTCTPNINPNERTLPLSAEATAPCYRSTYTELNPTSTKTAALTAGRAHTTHCICSIALLTPPT